MLPRVEMAIVGTECVQIAMSAAPRYDEQIDVHLPITNIALE